jgi:anti-sigma factor RsiW
MTPHRYADWDAAYVLGALSSADRREFEDHLAGCAPCRDAVAELAGMPGLLSAVNPVEALALDTPETDSTVPEVGPEASAETSAPAGAGAGTATSPRLQVVPSPTSGAEGATSNDGGERRKVGWGRRWLAVAAALVVLGGAGAGGYAISNAQHSTATIVSGPTRLAFSPVSASTMTAVVDVAPLGGQTSIKVECQYSAYGRDSSSWADYSVWAVDRNGQADLVTTWRARPDQVMRPSGTASVPVAQIAAIEIRRADSGQTVMRASLG